MSRPCGAISLAAVLLLVLATVALSADATSVPTAVLAGGDLRSEGEGPGLVGNPLPILAAVMALGLVTAGLTVLLVRVTRRD